MTWLHRAMRTRTQVHTPSAAQEQRDRGLAAAIGVMAALQLGCQMLLWVTFYGYSQLNQTVWLAALALLAPLMGLWLLWKGGQPALSTRAGRLCCLPLLLCLWLDMALLLCAMAGYIDHLIPEYPYWIGVVLPALACLLTVGLSGQNGVPYGCQVLCLLILPLFLLSTVLLGAPANQSRLYPIWGAGAGTIGLGALGGCGCLWGVGQGFLTRTKQKSPLWVLLPFGALFLWALWYGMVRPWSPGDNLATGAKLTALNRNSPNVFVFELSGILWTLLLPLSCAGCLYTGRRIVAGVWPQWPGTTAPLALAVSAAAVVCLRQDRLLVDLASLLPWRALVSAICGAALCVLTVRERRAS